MVAERAARQGGHPGAVALAATPAVQGNYEAMTVTELQALLAERGLPTTGLKAELVQRLVDNDAGV